MRIATIAILLAVTSLGIFASGSSASERLDVHLESDKSDYVVGETVVLQVAVRNNSDKELPVWVDSFDNQIQVFILGPDEVTREFTIGWAVLPDVMPNTLPLTPQDTAHYALRVLHTFNSKSPAGASALAFPQAGQYEVFVKYPLFPDRQMFESNRIRITIQEPEGVDAEIWAELDDAKTLFFLQRGGLWEQSRDVPAKVAELILRAPDSAYHSPMRWALGRYYYVLRTTTRDMYFPNPEDIENGKLFRKALGIVLLDPSVVWKHMVHDPRLHTRRFVRDSLQPMPLREVFALVTRQTGVPLKVDPTTNTRRTYASMISDQTLGEFMRGFTENGRNKWIRDGRGFRLVPLAPLPESSP